MAEPVAALVLFLVPLAYSPGPGNLFFAATGARFGFRATMRASLGYHIATWIVTAVIGIGFGSVLNNAPQVFVGLKIAGSLYVFWIAWKMLSAGLLKGVEAAKPAHFWDGVVLLVLNPKAYVIIALMFTQFLTPSDTDRMASVLLITTVFTVNNLIAFAVWSLVGDWLATQFRQPEKAHFLNVLFGLGLAAVAIWMLLS